MIVEQRCRRQHVPERTQISAYSLLVKSWKHFGLTVEELADSAVRVQESADHRVIFQTAEPFRGYRTHDIQPLGNRRTVGAEPAVDHGPGERVPGQVHEVIVELRPVIMFGAHVHGLVVVEKVEREGQHPAGALVLAIWPTWIAAIVGAVVLGIGFGVYLSVDFALLTEVLPSARDRAKEPGERSRNCLVNSKGSDP